MIYSGMFYLSGGNTSFTSIFLIMASIGINIAFFLLVIFYTYKAWKKDLKKLASKAKEKISTMRRSKNSRVSKAIIEKVSIEPTDTDFLIENFSMKI